MLAASRVRSACRGEYVVAGIDSFGAGAGGGDVTSVIVAVNSGEADVAGGIYCENKLEPVNWDGADVDVLVVVPKDVEATPAYGPE